MSICYLLDGETPPARKNGKSLPCVRLQAEKEELGTENAKLLELCKLFADYVSHDRCEGCICKNACNDGEIDECWQLAEIREAAHELGVEA